MLWYPLAELASVLTALALGLWPLKMTENDLALVLVAFAVTAVMIVSARRRKESGTVPDRLRLGPGRAWSEALVSAVILILLVELALSFVHEPYDEVRIWVLFRPGTPIATWVLRRLVLAAAQQVVLQLFVWPVCLEIFRRDTAAALAAAAVFGLLHAPSPVLIVVTFVAALVWVSLYRRSRRLVPLVVAHAVLWAAGYTLIPPRLSWDLKVGREALESRIRYQTLAEPMSREILREVTSRAYFEREGGSDRAWVIALYRDILGRRPADFEVAFWLDRLDWESQVEVARKFVISDELRQVRLKLGGHYAFPYSAIKPTTVEALPR